MSNPLVIAAVTSTLRSLVDSGLNADPNAAIANTTVTTMPPDRARGNRTDNQLNLFLYQILPNAALRNADMPAQFRGANGNETLTLNVPPLALNLSYLVTAYGQDGDLQEIHGQVILGRAISALHDHCLLTMDEMRDSLQGVPLQGLELERYFERIRITFQPTPLDELSKLWSGIQTQLRLSAAYQVGVVLIDSSLPGKAPLPVLRRGEHDRGPVAVPSSGPAISRVAADVQPPDSQPSLQLGDNLLIMGSNLDTEGMVAEFRHLRFPTPTPASQSLLPGASSSRARVHLPSPGEDPHALADWAVGFYTLSLRVTQADIPNWKSNEVPFALSPSITITSPRTVPSGNVGLTLTCVPRLRTGQQAILLFGERQIPAESMQTPADESQPSSLTFSIPNVAPGEYVVRLRIDGTDSLPFVREQTASGVELRFDPEQTVTVT